MKRITALLLACIMMLGSVGVAEADGIEIKVKGQWDFNFEVTGNRGWYTNANRSPGGLGHRPGAWTGRKKDRRDDDRYYARQRIRTQVNFITSEYLQAVLHFEIGDLDWGSNKNRAGYAGRGAGAQLDGDGVNIETKHAYLDWLIPETDVSVRMGIQRVSLPSTRMNNPILDADVAGIIVSSPITDWLSVTAGWIRPWNKWTNDNDNNEGYGWGRRLHDETDGFAVILPMTFKEIGTSISPYALYALVGGASGHAEYMFGGQLDTNKANDKAKAWWAGMNITVDLLDPLVGSLDVAYGRLSRSDYDFGGLGSNTEIHAGGWFIAGTLDYKLDWATPGIFGWWASGDRAKDLKNGRFGRMPFVSNDGGNFGPTSFGTAGFYGIGNGGNDVLTTGTGLGTWGIGIQLADASFIEDLSHTLRFAYYQGTNSKKAVKRAWKNGNPNYALSGLAYYGDNIYMTTADKAFEINFDHKYQIYENLTAVLELGYIHFKTDRDIWGGSSNLKENSNAYKVGLNFRYRF